MRDRPILFSAPMVRAILDGRKTMTRRVYKQRAPAPYEIMGEIEGAESAQSWPHAMSDDGEYHALPCPYGAPGDRLWVRETWAQADGRHSVVPVLYRADGDDQPVLDGKWRPSIFMRREHSRITLEVTGVRVERVRDISAADIIAEGVVERAHGDSDLGKCPVSAFDGRMYLDLLSLWATGWDSINADRGYSWASNPWVWVVAFRREGGG